MRELRQVAAILACTACLALPIGAPAADFTADKARQLVENAFARAVAMFIPTIVRAEIIGVPAIAAVADGGHRVDLDGLRLRFDYPTELLVIELGATRFVVTDTDNGLQTFEVALPLRGRALVADAMVATTFVVTSSTLIFTLDPATSITRDATLSAESVAVASGGTTISIKGLNYTGKATRRPDGRYYEAAHARIGTIEIVAPDGSIVTVHDTTLELTSSGVDVENAAPIVVRVSTALKNMDDLNDAVLALAPEIELYFEAVAGADAAMNMELSGIAVQLAGLGAATIDIVSAAGELRYEKHGGLQIKIRKAVEGMVVPSFPPLAQLGKLSVILQLDIRDLPARDAAHRIVAALPDAPRKDDPNAQARMKAFVGDLVKSMLPDLAAAGTELRVDGTRIGIGALAARVDGAIRPSAASPLGVEVAIVAELRGLDKLTPEQRAALRFGTTKTGNPRDVLPILQAFGEPQVIETATLSCATRSSSAPMAYRCSTVGRSASAERARSLLANDWRLFYTAGAAGRAANRDCASRCHIVGRGPGRSVRQQRNAAAQRGRAR